MTHWAFAVGRIEPLGDEPQALVLAVPEGGDRAVRSGLRRQTLGTLAGGSLAAEAVELAAGADRVRRLSGHDVFASVAWRDGWTAAVIARHPVGIDIERVADAGNAAATILGRTAGVDLARWHGLAGVWAAREAVLKAQGLDLTADNGAWRFDDGAVHHSGHQWRVDLAAHGPIVAAVAYAGG